MTHPPSKVFQSYLIDEGIFIAPGDSGSWPAFISSTPESPDQCGTIYDTAGTLDGIIQKTGEQIEHFGLQVRIRSSPNAYEAGWNKAREIYDQAGQVRQVAVTVDGADYVIRALTPTTTVTPLGVEEGTKRRELFTVNFIATISEV